MTVRTLFCTSVLTLAFAGCQRIDHMFPDATPLAPEPAAARTAGETSSVNHYSVYRGVDLVLDFSPGAGALVSSAPPPPPGAPVPPPHPFLHGAAHDPQEESRLRDVLTASTSVEDFVHRLEAAGYRVRVEH